MALDGTFFDLSRCTRGQKRLVAMNDGHGIFYTGVQEKDWMTIRPLDTVAIQDGGLRHGAALRKTVHVTLLSPAS